MDARLWIEPALHERSRIGLRRAVVTDGRAPAQTRVAQRVAAGLSDQELAGTLYRSARTVESHLTKIHREYRVRCRGQLIAALAAGRSDGPNELGPKEDATCDETGVPVRVGAAGDVCVGADGLRVEPLTKG